jgi:protein TonB
VPSDTPHPPLRQRATSLVLAVAVTLLLIVGLLSLNGRMPERPRFKGAPVMLDLQPDAEKADTTKRQAAPKPEPAPAPKQPPPPPKPVPMPVPPEMPTRSYFIHLTREDNDAADISKIRHADSAGAGVQQASAGGDSRPVGTAPDGQPLYNAEWYRPPTDAELAFYLPAHRQVEGSGLVACRTIAHYHVEDCVELGSSPPGSHLAGAVRQAAWQFLVRPPRLGGKTLVGAWVRILIEYHIIVSDAREKPRDGAAPGDGPQVEP